MSISPVLCINSYLILFHLQMLDQIGKLFNLSNQIAFSNLIVLYFVLQKVFRLGYLLQLT